MNDPPPSDNYPTSDDCQCQSYLFLSVQVRLADSDPKLFPATSSGGYGTNEYGNAFSDKNQRGGNDGFEKGTFSDTSSDPNTMKNAGGFQPVSGASAFAETCTVDG